MFLYGGNIPSVVSLYFASQRIPTACPCCAGSISTIGLAPFCFKPAGLALSWASAVLLWFLALLYIFLIDLSIRRVHKDRNIKLCSSWKTADGTCKMPLSVRCARTIVPFGEELCALQGGLPRKSRRKADAVLRAACPCHLPAGVPPRRKTGGLTDFRYAVIINMYRSGCNPRRDTYTNFIYRAYKVCTMGHFWWKYFPECPEKAIET